MDPWLAMNSLVTWELLPQEIAPNSTHAMLQLSGTWGQHQHIGMALHAKGKAILRLVVKEWGRLCAALSH